MIDDGIFPGAEIGLERVIECTIGCTSAVICQEIASLLEKPGAEDDDFYFSGQEYIRRPSRFDSDEGEREYVVRLWNHIANDLSHGRRFFNKNAKDFLELLIHDALNGKDSR